MPTAIARIAGDDTVALVWQNELGGMTARIERPSETVFAKWDPTGSPASLTGEAQRMRWLAQAGMRVPVVVGLMRDPTGDLLITEAIDAESIVTETSLQHPERAAAALGEGLRRLHALPAADCPFPAPSWTASQRIDDPVVCHGDPCVPNTLVAGGAFAGLVDLGDAGVGDRWSDLAIASWSLAWNGLAAAEPAFWDAYGARSDARRLAQWRALWAPPL